MQDRSWKEKQEKENQNGELCKDPVKFNPRRSTRVFTVEKNKIQSPSLLGSGPKTRHDLKNLRETSCERHYAHLAWVCMAKKPGKRVVT